MSWEQLASIAREWKQMRQEAETERVYPRACPNDGEPMRTGPDGQLYCPFDGYRP